MNIIENVNQKWAGLLNSGERYPLAILFLLIAAILNMVMIQNNWDHFSTFYFVCMIGAALAVVAQQIYETFFKTRLERTLLLTAAILLTIGYYFAVHQPDYFNIEISTKSAVFVFALLIFFIWIPSAKKDVSFHESFMASFKAFFTALLFAVVLTIGIEAIIFAMDQLIVEVNAKIYAHVLNIVFTLFTPIFFLSLIPLYPRRNTELSKAQQEKFSRAVHCPKMVHILISYIIIPLTMIYTIILLIYVLLNITGDFWNDNLLEPMLISYAIIVILVYFLASSLDNPVVTVFKSIFPKILIPIVLFQTIASILKIGETGVTNGRYYVIMFGIFALIAGIIFSFFPMKKHGWVAMFLIVFAIVSITPPVDAFSVSRANQIALLKDTLTENDMLEDGDITPNEDVSEKDQKTITMTVSYLERFDYTKDISWLPDSIYQPKEFEETFGFQEKYEETSNEPNNFQSANVDWETAQALDIQGYDQMVYIDMNFQYPGENKEQTIPLKMDDSDYDIQKEAENDKLKLILKDGNHELMTFDVADAFSQILNKEHADSLSIDDATVTEENEDVKMTLVASTIHYDESEYSGEIYLFVKIK